MIYMSILNDPAILVTGTIDTGLRDYQDLHVNPEKSCESCHLFDRKHRGA